MSLTDPVPPTPLIRQKGRPPDPNRRCPVELRTCRRHGLTEFAHYSRGREGRQWRCKRCVGEAVTRRKQLVKQLLIEEGGGCCAVCGYDRCAVTLTFHHVDPEEKSFPLSMHTTKSLAAYRDELQKCVLVCANCHGEIEAQLIASPPPGATFEDVLYRYAWRLGIPDRSGYEADMSADERRNPDGRSYDRDPHTEPTATLWQVREGVERELADG